MGANDFSITLQEPVVVLHYGNSFSMISMHNDGAEKDKKKQSKHKSVKLLESGRC